MKKSFLVSKDLQLNDIIEGTGRPKPVQRPQKAGNLLLVGPLRSNNIILTPEKQLFKGISYKKVQAETEYKKTPQDIKLNLVQGIFKNAIQRQKALIKLERNKKIGDKVKKPLILNQEETEGIKKEEKGLKRTMTLKNLLQLQKKNEIKKLQSLLTPTIRSRTQTTETNDGNQQQIKIGPFQKYNSKQNNKIVKVVIAIKYQIRKGMTAFLSCGQSGKFCLFHLFLGMAPATRILRVEKKNRNDSKFWHTRKQPSHSIIQPKQLGLDTYLNRNSLMVTQLCFFPSSSEFYVFLGCFARVDCRISSDLMLMYIPTQNTAIPITLIKAL